MCNNTLAKFQANLSDLPVYVANKIVAFVRFNKAFLIKKAMKQTALERKQKRSR